MFCLASGTEQLVALCSLCGFLILVLLLVVLWSMVLGCVEAENFGSELFVEGDFSSSKLHISIIITDQVVSEKSIPLKSQTKIDQ